MSKDTGIVKIHGKDYITVAKRIELFREDHPLWTIATEILSIDENYVVMKASITDAEGHLISTGHAEERRNSSMINKTSAVENCETSCIGRALAAFKYAGGEFASADEVSNALTQQQNLTPQPKQQGSNLSESGKECPKCGSPMKLRDGKYGKFWGCGNFPNCKHMEKHTPDAAQQQKIVDEEPPLFTDEDVPF